jgi:hypothetical protein
MVSSSGRELDTAALSEALVLSIDGWLASCDGCNCNDVHLVSAATSGRLIGLMLSGENARVYPT